mmetsp:Transcript_73575/g.239507  ORF Transcript_73575/g.239507 Transcript_73575/m.239507 type:complete len:396 (-) Transcript_73575:288-1475(-)
MDEGVMDGRHPRRRRGRGQTHGRLLGIPSSHGRVRRGRWDERGLLHQRVKGMQSRGRGRRCGPDLHAAHGLAAASETPRGCRSCPSEQSRKRLRRHGPQARGPRGRRLWEQGHCRGGSTRRRCVGRQPRRTGGNGILEVLRSLGSGLPRRQDLVHAERLDQARPLAQGTLHPSRALIVLRVYHQAIDQAKGVRLLLATVSRLEGQQHVAMHAQLHAAEVAQARVLEKLGHLGIAERGLAEFNAKPLLKQSLDARERDRHPSFVHLPDELLHAAAQLLPGGDRVLGAVLAWLLALGAPVLDHGLGSGIRHELAVGVAQNLLAGDRQLHDVGDPSEGETGQEAQASLHQELRAGVAPARKLHCRIAEAVEVCRSISPQRLWVQVLGAVHVHESLRAA